MKRKQASSSVSSGLDTILMTDQKEAFIMRLDMPGCPDSDLVYWVDDAANSVHFFANEPTMPEYKTSGRKYGFSVLSDGRSYNIREAKGKLLHGVLWITFPTVPKILDASVDDSHEKMIMHLQML